MSTNRRNNAARPAAKAGAVPGDQGKVAAMQQIEESRARACRAEKLLSGEVEPPNEMAAYLVEQLRDAHGERRAVTRNIAEMEQRIAQLRRRQVELEGLARKYIEDLDYWASKGGRAGGVPGPKQPEQMDAGGAHA